MPDWNNNGLYNAKAGHRGSSPRANADRYGGDRGDDLSESDCEQPGSREGYEDDCKSYVAPRIASNPDEKEYDVGDKVFVMDSNGRKRHCIVAETKCERGAWKYRLNEVLIGGGTKSYKSGEFIAEAKLEWD